MYGYEIEKTDDHRCVVLGGADTLAELQSSVSYYIDYYTHECQYTVEALVYEYCPKCEGHTRIKTCRKKHHLHSDYTCYKQCPQCKGQGKYPFYLDSVV